MGPADDSLPEIHVEVKHLPPADPNAGESTAYQVVVKGPDHAEIIGPRTFTLDPERLIHGETGFALERDLKSVLGEEIRRDTDERHSAAASYDGLRSQLQHYGRTLFSYLFDPDAWWAFLTYNREVREKGARIVLRLHSNAFRLWNVAWEYLFDGAEFLATSGKFQLVRAVEGLGELRPEPVAPPLRILAVIASPSDQSHLDSDNELSLIQTALERPRIEGRVELEVLDDATRANLRAAIEFFNPHVLYYTGHGGTSRDGDGKSFLCLEKEADAKTDELRADVLRRLVLKGPDLRLVFLNGCQTARTGSGAAFSGVGTTLLRENIPLIIANQFSILDPSATVFAGAFFRDLGAGRTLEKALDSGRQAMLDRLNKQGLEGLDWGVPAAYVRTTGLVLVDPAAPVPKETQVRRATLVAKELALPPHWVGRKDELRQIRRALRSTDVAAVYIWGFPGIGKTALAAKVVETVNRVEARFDDVFVFRGLTANNWKFVPTSLGEWLEGRGDPGHAEAGAILKGIKGTPRERLDAAAERIGNKRYLLIFDNFEAAMTCVNEKQELYDIADEIDDAEALKKGDHPLREFFARFLALGAVPGLGWRHKCLFTARRRWAAAAARQGKGDLIEVHLGALRARQALYLMDRKPNLSTLPLETRLKLYAKVGGHPKTLELLDGYLADRSVEEFLKNPDFAGLAAGSPDWDYAFVKKLVARLSPPEQEVIKDLAILEDTFDDEAIDFFCERAGIQADADRRVLRAKLINLSLLE